MDKTPDSRMTKKDGKKEEEKTDKQLGSSKVPQLKPFQWKKGQSGNPKGRKPGKSLKEFARQYLQCLSEEDKVKFLAGLPMEIVWKMAEGNPQNDITSGGKPIEADPKQKELTNKLLDQFLNGGNKKDSK